MFVVTKNGVTYQLLLSNVTDINFMVSIWSDSRKMVEIDTEKTFETEIKPNSQIYSVSINYDSEESNHKTDCLFYNSIIHSLYISDYCHSVSLLEAPNIIEKLEAQYKVDEGKTVIIDCAVGGDPEPDVDWFFNGETVKDEGR